MAGAKKRWRPTESILSPPFFPTFYSRKLGCLRNRGTLSNALCSLSDDHPPRASIPLPPIFHKICIRGCAADSCFEFRDILACVCQRNPLSLSLSGRHWNDTGSLMPPNLPSYPFLFIASIEQDEINLYTQFLHGSARIRLSSRYGTWWLDLGWAAFLETREDVGGRSWIIWGFWEYLMNTFRIFIDDLMIHRLEIKDIGSMIGFSFKLLRNNIEIIFY